MANGEKKGPGTPAPNPGPSAGSVNKANVQESPSQVRAREAQPGDAPAGQTQGQPSGNWATDALSGNQPVAATSLGPDDEDDPDLDRDGEAEEEVQLTPEQQEAEDARRELADMEIRKAELEAKLPPPPMMQPQTHAFRDDKHRR